MSDSASISSGIAERYATAVFGIVTEAGELPTLEANLDDLSAALNDSADLRDLLVNPVYSRDAQGAAIGSIADKMGLMPALNNALRLMASKRRLFVVPQMVTRLREMIATEKGEVTAEVTSATALTDAQTARNFPRRSRPRSAATSSSMRPSMKVSSVVLSSRWARR